MGGCAAVRRLFRRRPNPNTRAAAGGVGHARRVPGRIQTDESAKFQTVVPIDPRRYRHWAFGTDFVQLGKFPLAPRLTVSVKRLGLRWTKGTEHGVPEVVTIDDEPQDFDTFSSGGAQAVLDAYFKAHDGELREGADFTIQTMPQGLTRWQADGDGSLTVSAGGREYAVEMKFRFRWPDPAGDFRSPFLLSREVRAEFKLSIPLLWRLKLTPSYTYHHAKIADEENNVFKFHSLDIRLSLP